jgi:hypothetical protein
MVLQPLRDCNKTMLRTIFVEPELVFRGALATMPRRPMQGMRCLALLGSLLLPDIVKADVIKCSFTEPFMTTSYDTSLQKMTVTYDVEKRRKVFDGITMREIRPKVFEFRNAQGQVLQRVERSCRGSDGMSDRVYPYQAEWILQKLHGGCTSSGMTKC